MVFSSSSSVCSALESITKRTQSEKLKRRKKLNTNFILRICNVFCVLCILKMCVGNKWKLFIIKNWIHWNGICARHPDYKCKYVFIERKTCFLECAVRFGIWYAKKAQCFCLKFETEMMVYDRELIIGQENS